MRIFQSQKVNSRYLSIIILVLTMMVIQPLAHGQSLGGKDLKSVKVDDLSDQEILGYIQEAEQRGLTQAQLEALAIQRGVSKSEISKFRKRVQSLKRGGNEKGESKIDVSSKRSTESLDKKDMLGSLPREVSSSSESSVFGFDLFQKESLSFAPNLSLPTPLDYQLGPGDELVIDLWGDIQEFYKLEISFEGTVRPEGLSPIFVNGLSIEEASKKIIDRLSQKNSGLKAQNEKGPTIFHQISLGNIRTINVEVVGEVGNPSIYALPSLATVYTAIHAAGGPTQNGSFRDIRLIRNNKLIGSIDIYSFLTDGIRSGDQHLKNGDVIIVKPFSQRVTLTGNVKTAGIFELKKEENFRDLLKYASGFSSTAFKSNITVKRNGEKNREIINVSTEEFTSFKPKDGDVITVSKISSRFSNRVIINGAVFRKGEYQLTDGLTLKQLIQKAEGLKGDAYTNRVTIYRTNEDFSQTTIPIDLKALMNGTVEDILLVREDMINVPSIYDLREEYYVQIFGEVIENGVYQFFNQMTVEDLIILAGGLKESASGSLIEISRRNKNKGVSSSAEIINLSIDEALFLKNEDRSRILEPFDHVFIRKSPGYSVQKFVNIEGEVIAPGTYTISKKDERISDIIERARGLSPYAFPKGAILVRKTEFSDSRTNNEINDLQLELLRSKILSNKSGVTSYSQEKLINRLDNLTKQSNNSGEYDKVGSALKKDLIVEISERDSLIRDIVIRETEPVAIDLERILEGPGSKYDLIIKPGDVISIPGKLETIRVAGEVTSALNFRYDKSFSFKDYIYQSGGFLQSAKKGRSYVQYPNGERKGVKRFLWFKKYPKIEPGSTIFVSRKARKSRTSLQEVLAITSSLATLVFLVEQIRR